MVVDMELQEAKDYVLQLMKRRDEMEAKLKTLNESLLRNYDSEGNAREDIDLNQVRQARQAIACLKNDLKALMGNIEEGIHKLHSLAANSQKEDIEATTSSTEEVPLEPFLRVNLVTPDSPAAMDGILVDDLILKFGSIDYQNFKSLNDIGTLVENSKGKPVDLKIKRGSKVKHLMLVPRPWSGRGLLGCNVIPVEIVER